VCGSVAMYSHNLAIFVLVVPDAFLLVRREWRKLGQIILAQLAIGLVALPWLILVPGQIAKIQAAFWTPQPGIVEILQAFVMLVTQLPLPGIWLVGGLTLSLLVVGFVLLETVRLVRKRSFPWFLLVLTGLPPGLLFVASYLMRPVFVPRGFLAAALGFLGVSGVIIAQRWRRIPSFLILGGLIAGAGIGLPFHYTFNEFPRSPFQPAMAFIQSQMLSGDRVVHDNKLSFFPSHYYAPDISQSFLADDLGRANDTLAPASQEALGLFPAVSLARAVGDAQRVFFVAFSGTVQEYRQAGFSDHPQVTWLKETYPLVQETQFNDLIVYQFSR
jgi:mannosyltransferase